MILINFLILIIYLICSFKVNNNKVLKKLLSLDLMDHNIYNFHLEEEILLNNLDKDNKNNKNNRDNKIIYLIYFNKFNNNNIINNNKCF
jgi:hypothetical protein